MVGLAGSDTLADSQGSACFQKGKGGIERTLRQFGQRAAGRRCWVPAHLPDESHCRRDFRPEVLL